MLQNRGYLIRVQGSCIEHGINEYIKPHTVLVFSSKRIDTLTGPIDYTLYDIHYRAGTIGSAYGGSRIVRARLDHDSQAGPPLCIVVLANVLEHVFIFQ